VFSVACGRKIFQSDFLSSTAHAYAGSFVMVITSYVDCCQIK